MPQVHRATGMYVLITWSNWALLLPVLQGANLAPPESRSSSPQGAAGNPLINNPCTLCQPLVSWGRLLPAALRRWGVVSKSSRGALLLAVPGRACVMWCCQPRKPRVGAQ